MEDIFRSEYFWQAVTGVAGVLVSLISAYVPGALAQPAPSISTTGPTYSNSSTFTNMHADGNITVDQSQRTIFNQTMHSGSHASGSTASSSTAIDDLILWGLGALVALVIAGGLFVAGSTFLLFFTIGAGFGVVFQTLRLLGLNTFVKCSTLGKGRAICVTIGITSLLTGVVVWAFLLVRQGSRTLNSYLSELSSLDPVRDPFQHFMQVVIPWMTADGPQRLVSIAFYLIAAFLVLLLMAIFIMESRRMLRAVRASTVKMKPGDQDSRCNIENQAFGAIVAAVLVLGVVAILLASGMPMAWFESNPTV